MAPWRRAAAPRDECHGAARRLGSSYWRAPARVLCHIQSLTYQAHVHWVGSGAPYWTRMMVGSGLHARGRVGPSCYSCWRRLCPDLPCSDYSTYLVCLPAGPGVFKIEDSQPSTPMESQLRTMSRLPPLPHAY